MTARPQTAPTPPVPAVDVPEPLAEPRRDWDDPRTCAQDDARYWDALYDRDEDS